MQFVDTNIFLRYLTQDDPQKYKACLALFQQAERAEVNLTTSEAVIAEVVFVLSSSKHYRLTHVQIQSTLSRLLLLPGLKIANRNTYLRALAIYAKHELDFEDCLSVACMEQAAVKQIYSYDRGFDRFNDIQRLEPTLSTAEMGSEVVQSNQATQGATTKPIHDD